MQLSQRIIIARQQKGYTQEELATLAKLSIRTIQRIESGESVPRGFTLKAIAAALNLPAEQFLTDPNEQLMQVPPEADNGTAHFLQLFNLSCFSFIVIPWVHVLIPGYLLKKQKDLNRKEVEWCRKIIRQQVIWVICLHLVMLLALGYNLLQGYVFHNRQHASYLWPFFIMYMINTGIIFLNLFSIRKEYNRLDLSN
ncbi:helix-turn-helix domain-containing protein [Niastella populi]|uniref:HTH cro/C1-type domain-containing protein n=1 Tax=Niastella populi TaxID=550983 RepID=A0A1V9G6N4_9BACT|nr:helix-turn-helix transcriptional regulator [Niastella populi]OQP66222.1 hypothetical protein A4R26_14135 [Niastella populi]